MSHLNGLHDRLLPDADKSAASLVRLTHHQVGRKTADNQKEKHGLQTHNLHCIRLRAPGRNGRILRTEVRRVSEGVLPSAGGASECSPARKRWDFAYETLKSPGGAQDLDLTPRWGCSVFRP